MNKPPFLIDPCNWFIKGTPGQLASIPKYDTRDGLPLFAMSHSDLPEGDPLRTLCDDEPAPECTEAVAKLIGMDQDD